jgi:hypothetical protein
MERVHWGSVLRSRKLLNRTQGSGSRSAKMGQKPNGTELWQVYS